MCYGMLHVTGILFAVVWVCKLYQWLLDWPELGHICAPSWWVHKVERLAVQQRDVRQEVVVTCGCYRTVA